MPNPDESQLIQRAQQGDRVAMSDLYNRHVDRIYQYVRYRIGDEQTAEDITAEVFLRAIEGLGSYRDQGIPFIAWLYRIAYARIIDVWRRSRRSQTAPLEDPLLQEGLAASDKALEEDVLQHRALSAAVLQLTDDQQRVIVLRFMQHLSNAEIAQVMGKTEGAVKALQRRALEALARLLPTR